MRGQWYIVAAVLFSFSLLTLFNIFNSYSRIDYTSVLKNDEDLIFPNLVEELNNTVENSENIKNLNADVGDLLEMAENSLIGKGYFFRYNLSTSGGFNLSNLELAGKNLKINYKYYRPPECDDGICDFGECSSGCTSDCSIADCCGIEDCNLAIGENCSNCETDCGPCNPIPGWSFRREINISNTGGDLTDYQVKITVDYDSDMQSDYDDLRFADTNSNNLSYWIEDYTTSNATVWVKVPFLENNTNTTIYMYYGNPSASSASNGTNTFEFFDNFDDGDYTNNPTWITSQNWIASNYYLQLQDSFLGMNIYSENISISSTTNLLIEYDTYIACTLACYNKMYLYNSTDDILFGGGPFHDDYNNRDGGLIIQNTSTSNMWTSLGVSTGSWKKIKLYIYLGKCVIDYDNGNIIRSMDCEGNLEDIQRIRISGWYHTNGARYDNIRVRKYASPEPTYTMGSEEPLS